MRLARRTVGPLAPGSAATIRVPIDVAAKMAALERQRAWPWALRVTVIVRPASGGDPVLRQEAELPIRPGN